MSKTKLSNSPTVSNWLSRLSKSSHKGMTHNFGTWFKWVGENGGKFSGFSPEDFVEFQKEAGNGERYEILDLIQRYVGTLEGRGGYKKTAYSNIRSFFRHNRVELPQDPTFTVRADKPKIVGTLTVDEIKQVIMSSNPCYRAVFTSMFQGGMGIGEVLFWSENGWEALQKELRGSPEVIKVDLPGRKKYRNSRPYFTLLGGDAIEALRNWVKHRPAGATQIFTNQFGKGLSINSISMYWLKHLKRLGIIEGGSDLKHKVRYGKNLHEIRDVFRSQWEVSTAKPSVSEFMMGHIVDKLGYNKAHRDQNWMIKEYRKALPKLQIMSSGRPFGQVDEDELDVLRAENIELRKQIEAQSLNNQSEIVEIKKQMEARDKKIDSMMEFIAAFSNQENGVESYKQFRKIEKQLEDSDGESDILPE